LRNISGKFWPEIDRPEQTGANIEVGRFFPAVAMLLLYDTDERGRRSMECLRCHSLSTARHSGVDDTIDRV